MKSKGFTLIELVVVIVILGILAAMAIPRYVDLSDQAKKAHDEATLHGLQSATHLLYAKSAADGAPTWPANAAAVYAQMNKTPEWQGYYTNATYTNGIWEGQKP